MLYMKHNQLSLIKKRIFFVMKTWQKRCQLFGYTRGDGPKESKRCDFDAPVFHRHSSRYRGKDHVSKAVRARYLHQLSSDCSRGIADYLGPI